MTTSVNGQTSRTTEHEAPSDADRLDELTVRRGLVGVLSAQHVELRSAGAGFVFAQTDVVMERSGARDVVSGGALRITQGGAGMVLAAGDVSIRRGGAGTMVALGRVDMEQSGAGVLVARDATVGRGGVAVLALTPRLAVAEGGRVFGGPAAVAAAMAGLTIGFFIGRIRRRRSA